MIAAAVYSNDMYVDRDLSIETGAMIKNINIWETELYEHDGLRTSGEKVLKTLFTSLKER